MTRTWRTLFSRVGEFNARIEENVGGIRVVQAFANEDHERRSSPATTRATATTKLEAYRMMATSMSLSYFSMRFTQLVVMIAGRLLRAARPVDERRLRQLPAAGRRLLPPGREDQRRPGDLPEGHRRLQPLHRAAGDTSRTSPTRRTRSPSATCAGDIRYENVTFGYAPHRTVLRNINLAIHAGRDGRLRRPVRRGQDDHLLAAAALLRGRRRADHDRRRSTSAT